MKTYDTLLKALSRLVEAITGALLCVIVLIVFYTVMSSRFAGETPAWANEVPLIMVVWFGLLGAGLGIRDKAHLAVEFVVRGMPSEWKVFFFRLSYTLVIFFAAAMIVAGMRLVLFVISNGETFPATKLSVAVCYAAIPCGGFFIVVHALRHLIDLFAGRYDFAGIDEADATGGGDNAEA